jgi:hypothetical protein
MSNRDASDFAVAIEARSADLAALSPATRVAVRRPTWPVEALVGGYVHG